MPESVFSAHLGLGFELLGWRSEREAQQGAGRADLILRRNGAAEAKSVNRQAANCPGSWTPRRPHLDSTLLLV